MLLCMQEKYDWVQPYKIIFRLSTLFPQKSDTVLLSIVNCLAVIYIYNQFSKLRKAGSKYILGQYTHTHYVLQYMSSDVELQVVVRFLIWLLLSRPALA